MYDKKIVAALMRRMIDLRTELLVKYPFFGQLIMHLDVALAPVGTAATDMKRIIFDPEFMDRLSDDELEFVLMHEVMHCVLKHCLRGKYFHQELFNIACDIVVNSNILAAMGKEEFRVDGVPAMHLVPNGKEGSLYTAEQVYAMLVSAGAFAKKSPKCIDSHDPWNGNKKGSQDGDRGGDGPWKDAQGGGPFSGAETADETWDRLTKEAAKKAGVDGKGCGGYVPPSVRALLADAYRDGRIDWRKVLADFIQLNCSRMDYSFAPADRRFTWLDYAIPGFVAVEEEVIKNLWFVVDCSGSVSNQLLSDFYQEIVHVTEQMENLEGKLSFFSTIVTDPVPFQSVEDLRELRPASTGGTSFHEIFRYMKKHMSEDLPVAVIVLTDGDAPYPPESMALQVPVLWVISNGGPKPEWGTVLELETETP